ncbi:MAG TPA: hypothetical protein VI583_01905 [Cyclobacteriaceae bacterium]|nr:hypothetical protein [Cyclobacteriaceae bacterium]
MIDLPQPFLFISFLLFQGSLTSPPEPVILKTDAAIIYDICFFDSGNSLAVADGDRLKTFSSESGNLSFTLPVVHKGQILSFDISRDNTMLVSGGRDSLMVYWNLVDRQLSRIINPSIGLITSIKISSAGKLIAAGGTARKLVIYDFSGNKVREYNDHSDDITDIAFSNDGRYLATAGADNMIFLYDNHAGIRLTGLARHTRWVRSISFNFDNTKLISCGDDSKVVIWNISDPDHPSLHSEIKLKADWLLSIDYAGNGNSFAVGGLNGKARVIGDVSFYSDRVGRPIQKIKFRPGTGIYFEIAVASRGKGVILFDSRDFKLNEGD